MKNPLSKIVFLTLSLAGLLVLGGCGLGTRAYPEKHYYDLTAPEGQPARKPLKAGKLMVLEIRAASALNDPKLVYKVGPHEFRSDFYHEFMAPPGRIWREALAGYLDKYGPLSEVTLSPGLKPAEYALEGFLSEMYADVTGPTPQAVVSLKLVLSDARHQDRRQLLSQVYERRLDLADDRPETYIQGLSQIMADIFTQFNADLRRLRWR